jgi:FtsP/CotA-like multicopper oxidase with cupredoxin domain
VLGGGLAALATAGAAAQGATPPPPADLPLIAQRMALKLTAEAKDESSLFRFQSSGESAHRNGAFRLKPGDERQISIENQLQQPLALHVRGLRRPQSGGVGEGILHGSTARLTFRGDQPGLFILSPAGVSEASEQMARGLADLLVIEEPNPPFADQDLALTLSDWRLTTDQTLDERFHALPDSARLGRLGNRMIVNGRPAPLAITARPGARIRLRLANTALARIVPLQVSGLQARVIAIDSTPCAPFDPLQRMVTLIPGGRCEMMLDLPREPGRAEVFARYQSPVPLLSIQIEGEALAARPPIGPLPDPGLPPAIRLQDAVRADFTVTGGLPRDFSGDQEAAARLLPDARRIFRINDGKVGDVAGEPPGAPLMRVRRGRVGVIALRNQTAWPQCVGLAGHSFRLLHAYDDGWEPYFLDTLHLAAGHVARIAFIAEWPGRHVLASTLPQHRLAGIASHIEVV